MAQLNSVTCKSWLGFASHWILLTKAPDLYGSSCGWWAHVGTDPCQKWKWKVRNEKSRCSCLTVQHVNLPTNEYCLKYLKGATFWCLVHGYLVSQDSSALLPPKTSSYQIQPPQLALLLLWRHHRTVGVKCANERRDICKSQSRGVKLVLVQDSHETQLDLRRARPEKSLPNNGFLKKYLISLNIFRIKLCTENIY